MEPVKTIMIGIGGMGKDHFKRLIVNPNCRLTAVCDPNLDREDVRSSVEKAKENNIPMFTDYREALEKVEAEACVIAAPHFLHRTMTIDALEKGLNVFVEKPPACCVEDCKAMLAAQEKAGKIVAVGFNPTTEPPTLALKQAIVEGKLGKIRELVVKMVWYRSEKYMERASWVGKKLVGGCVCADGVLNNQSTHYMTQALFLANSNPAPAMSVGTRIRAELFKAHATPSLEMEDLACAVIELDNDPDKKLYFYATTNNPGHEYTTVEVIGSEARSDGSNKLVFPDRVEELPALENVLSKHDNFFSAIREGAVVFCPLSEAVKNVYTIEAIYDSVDWNIRTAPWEAMENKAIEELIEKAAAARCLISELPDAPAWARK